MTNTLFDGLFQAGRQAPDRDFVRLPDGAIHSYGDILAATGRFANVLAELGVQPGDRVAAQVEKSLEAVLLYLGTIRAGAAFLPLNTAYTPAEIEYFLGDASPRVFVCDVGRKDSLSAIAAASGASLETLTSGGAGPAGTLNARLDAMEPDFETVSRGPSDLAAILYTSGTTGRSKGAMLSHDNLLSNAEILRDYWRFTERDVLLHALPIFHTHGLFVAINTLMVAGGSMILLPKFDLDAVFGHLPRSTSMMGIPTFYTRLLDDRRLTPEATRHMRLFTSGSAPLLSETHREFAARTGQMILERYGMTETNMNTSNPYDGERRPGTVGFPLPGVELRVVEPESGKPVPQGEVGVIEVKGPNVFSGYWNMPEKTASEFRPDGFFITGDLGIIDSDGYVTIVGRSKDLVISGGFNIYPKEIESVLDEVAGVNESAVIGVPHRDFGEGLVGVVIPERGAELTEEGVIGEISPKLARFKQPKRIVFLEELPRNTMGKVQKEALRKRFAGLFANAP